MKAVTIKKGKHYASIWKLVPMWNPDYLAYEVLFTLSCQYHEEGNIQLTEQINKLFGFTIGFNRHKNSIRFGWNYNERLGLIALYSYIYINGQRQEKLLQYVKTNKPIVLEIIKIGYAFYLRINGKNVLQCTMPHKLLCFRMNPFFGGLLPAPHDVTIQMERLEKPSGMLTTAMNVIETLKPSFQ